MRRDKKKRLARVLTVTTAVLLLLLFIVRDILRENWKDMHDSLAQAEALYEIHYGQNESAVRSEEEAMQGRQNLQKSTPAPDTADLNHRTLAILNEAQDELYRVSELIDALPSSATHERIELENHVSSDLLKLRDGHRVRLEQIKASWEKRPYETLQADYETVYIEHEKIIWLGILAVRAAKHELKATEHRIHICSYVIYSLGALVLFSGIYAAVIGLKLEGNEA